MHNKHPAATGLWIWGVRVGSGLVPKDNFNNWVISPAIFFFFVFNSPPAYAVSP